MFTGIVQGKATIVKRVPDQDLVRLAVEFPSGSVDDVKRGASIALNGVCLTVVTQQGNQIDFDVMQTSLQLTSLGVCQEGDQVNFERAMRAADEVGGHLLSGHVAAMGRITKIETLGHGKMLHVEVPEPLRPYLFSKGYIGVDGASLTIVDVTANGFTISLIPETLDVTVLGGAAEGTPVNIEIDSQTRAVVDTVERVLAQRLQS
ncbi:riboflavin synthase subunit alpha [Salinispirillum sp. LH 10-3-1]|uniref:Riboflavin synthase n=1 Tax=Salinispirillum sp. LH 10-3-1 TaxID=2952525 RepID=A0AB38YCQ2_9GAMM